MNLAGDPRDLPFQQLAQHLPTPCWISDAEGTITWVNDAWLAYTGKGPEDMLGDGLASLHDPEVLPEVRRRWAIAKAEAQPAEMVFPLRGQDGVLRPFLTRVVPLTNAEGQVSRWFGTNTDITEQLRTRQQLLVSEASLQEKEERLRLATAAADIGTWDFDPISGALQWDERCKALFGLPPDAEVDYPTFLSGVHADDREATDRAVQRALEPDGPGGYEVEYRTIGLEDGIERWIAARGRGIFDGEGPARRAVRFIGTVLDISQSKQAEKELERRVEEALAERKLWADLVEGTDAFVQVASPDFRWLAINNAAASEFQRIFGTRRPEPGDSMLELLADQPEHLAAVKTVWSRALSGEEFTETGEFGEPGLDRRWYEMKYNVLRDREGRMIGAYQFVYDVTARERSRQRLLEAEEQLRQSQKIDTLGQLTGGVAHDFNNLLTPIVGTLDMLRRKINDDRSERLISGALQAAERAKTLVQRLLAFSRRQHLQPRPTDLRALIDGMTDLIAKSVGPRITLEVDVAEGLPAAMVDANQFELAVLNLAVNARDAMPSGGKLTISVNQDDVTDGSVRLAPGTYLRVTIADTGVGMDADTLRRATEPFFTTKGVGRGTGLGLASVQGLAAQTGGNFKLASHPGRGTEATIWLPITDKPVETVVIDELGPAFHAPRETTLLLVDDEELVRTGTAEMLIEAGYTVIQAASGFAALQLVKDGMAPDALITDYAMPGLTGTELARELRLLKPDLPVLLMTGFATLSDRDAVGLPRLSKPFRQADLLATIAELVGSGRLQLLPKRAARLSSEFD